MSSVNTAIADFCSPKHIRSEHEAFSKGAIDRWLQRYQANPPATSEVPDVQEKNTEQSNQKYY